MTSLEQLLKKTTTISPEKYCRQNNKKLQDYVCFLVIYDSLDSTGKKFLEHIFKKYPHAETISKYSKDRLHTYTRYQGMLMIPRADYD